MSDNDNFDLSLDDIFSRINKSDADENKIQKPFKFLDAYSASDKDIFYGRETEIKEIYKKFYSADILLVYGKSGTGKSSVINCGLISEIPSSDLFPINIRTGKMPYANLIDILQKISKKNDTNAVTLLEKIYHEKFKPIALIFDQFEEIFILADETERKKFINEVKKISDSALNVNFIFIIREEYYANLTEFEALLPNIYSNRIRIEPMNKNKIKEIITQPCKVCNVGIDNELPDNVIELVSKNGVNIELTWLQIIMDKLYKKATERNQQKPHIKLEDFKNLGKIDDVLTNFLDEQLENIKDTEAGENVLKCFVSDDGTKRPLKIQEINEILKNTNKQLPQDKIKNIVKYFTDVRILTDKDEKGYYELRHDSLASRIYEKMSATEKEISEIINFINSAFAIYQKRHKLLDETDLDYIRIYENKIFLNKEIKDFINKSKTKLKKEKNRKRNLLLFVAFFISLTLSISLIWAVSEKQKAIENRNKAIIEKQRADSLYKLTLLTNYEKFKNLGDQFLAEEDFDKAKENYLLAKSFIDSTQIDSLLDYTDYAQNTAQKLNQLIHSADSLATLGTSHYGKAIELYEQALNLQYKQDEINEKIQNLNNKINNRVKMLLTRAEKLFQQGYKDMAKRRLDTVFMLQPDNQKAKQLLSKYY